MLAHDGDDGGNDGSDLLVVRQSEILLLAQGDHQLHELAHHAQVSGEEKFERTDELTTGFDLRLEKSLDDWHDDETAEDVFLELAVPHVAHDFDEGSHSREILRQKADFFGHLAL